MSNILAVDSTNGRRVFLSIQNQARAQDYESNPENGAVGIAFDQAPSLVSECPLKLYPGGSVLFDRTVPQNRIFLVSQSAVIIPVGIVTANIGG